MSEVKQFRKKPVVIEAMQWNGRADETGIYAVLAFIGDMKDLPHAPDDPHIDSGIGFTPSDGLLFIPTLEGTMQARPGDWIIKGVNSEFYPCKPDIFAATYESVDAADPRIAAAEQMAKALTAWEHWYSHDSTEFNRDMAQSDGVAALAAWEATK